MMAIFLKRALLIAVSLTISSDLVHAKFDKAIVDSYMKMASEGYKIEGHRVHKAVQAANLLAHELALEANPAKAKDMADTLLAMISTGEGVGGISQRPANDGERPLMVKALQEATRFLQTEDGLNEAQLSARLKTDEIRPDYQRLHIEKVFSIARTVVLNGGPEAAGGLPAAPDGPQPVRQRIYNTALKREIDRLRADEEAADGKMDYKDVDIVQAYVASLASEEAPPLENLRTLTDKLKTTVIPEKAYRLTCTLVSHLKAAVFNFEELLDAPNSMRAVVDALIAVGTYRMFETRQGYLEKTDPSIFTFQNTKQSDESEAILLALVSAIQNYLYNPEATPEDLIRLFKYQINSRKLDKPGVRTAAKAMIDDNRINNFINPDLLGRISQLQLKITDMQKLDIDAAAMKQKLFFIGIPEFDFDTSKFSVNYKYVGEVKSKGDGECGYYSLRRPGGRQEYIEQIVDNLDEPEIYEYAIGVTNVGRDLFLERKGKFDLPPDEQRIVDEINLIDTQYEAKLKELYIPDKVDHADDYDMAELKRTTKLSYDNKKIPHYTQLAKAVSYKIEDLAKRIEEEVYAITVQGGGNRGWYTSTATADWGEQSLQPDLISMVLNNTDAYFWVPTSVKGIRLTIIDDDQNALLGYSTLRKELHSSRPRRIHLYNETGRVHYDKLVEADAYADMAAALRHKQRHGLGNTR